MSGMERGVGQAPAAEITQSADLVLLDVDVYRRSLHLIDCLTLAVGPGRILGVSGASGAGKSSLLAAGLIGLLPARSGADSGRCRRRRRSRHGRRRTPHPRHVRQIDF